MIRSRHALTLIELLVAMGIAVLLAGVVFAVYTGTLGTLDSQARWRARAYPAAAALDVLSLDLASAVIPWGITNSPFVLTPARDDSEGLKLHFFTAMPASLALSNQPQTQNVFFSKPDVRVYAIREMDYILSSSNAAATNERLRAAGGLTRAWQAFRLEDPDGIVSNRDVWPGIREIKVEVYDGTCWTNTWGDGTNLTLPQAARVMLAVQDDPAGWRASEVLIPAGQRIAAPKTRK